MDTPDNVKMGAYAEGPRAIKAVEELMEGIFKRNMERVGLKHDVSNEGFLPGK